MCPALPARLCHSQEEKGTGAQANSHRQQNKDSFFGLGVEEMQTASLPAKTPQGKVSSLWCELTDLPTLWLHLVRSRTNPGTAASPGDMTGHNGAKGQLPVKWGEQLLLPSPPAAQALQKSPPSLCASPGAHWISSSEFHLLTWQNTSAAETG